MTAVRPMGSVSRALGAAAVAAAILLAARYAAEALAFLVEPPVGELAAAALLAALGQWAAPAVGRRLGAGAPVAAAPWAALRGVVAGAAAAGVLALLLWLTLGVRWGPAAGLHAVLLPAAALAAAWGYTEEAFVRGAAFGVLQRRAGRTAALWGAAILLAVTDLVAGADLLAALGVACLGLWWGTERLRSGSGVFPAAAHAAWNAALGPLLGLGGESVGGRSFTLLTAHLGAAWWAGMPDAAQGGLAAVLVAALAAALALRIPGPGESGS